MAHHAATYGAVTPPRRRAGTHRRPPGRTTRPVRRSWCHPLGWATTRSSWARSRRTARATGLRVTAYGSSAVHCYVLDPTFYADPEVLRVGCYDATGSAVNSRFALSYSR